MEVLDTNARRGGLPERVKRTLEYAAGGAVVFLALTAQTLHDDASASDVLKQQLGVADMAEVQEVQEIPGLLGCPTDETTVRLPDMHVNSHKTADYNPSDWNRVEMGGTNGVMQYEIDGVTVYCGESIGVLNNPQFPQDNPPEGTIMVIPESLDAIVYESPFLHGPQSAGPTQPGSS